MQRNCFTRCVQVGIVRILLVILVGLAGCDSGSSEDPAIIDGTWKNDDSDLFIVINLRNQTLDAYFEFSSGCFNLTAWTIEPLNGNRYQQNAIDLDASFNREVEIIVEEDRLLHIYEFVDREGEPGADVSVYYRIDRDQSSFQPPCEE